MKKIKLLPIKRELQKLDIDDFSIQLMLNNISLYNDLIDTYLGSKGEKKQAYLLYQLNMQIFKMLNEMKKMKELSKEEQDTFTDFINKFKGKIEKR